MLRKIDPSQGLSVNYKFHFSYCCANGDYYISIPRRWDYYPRRFWTDSYPILASSGKMRELYHNFHLMFEDTFNCFDLKFDRSV